MFFEEGPDLLPAVDRLLLPVGRSVIVEESVASTVIAVEFVILALLFQLLLMLVHLGRGRGLVIVAEEAQDLEGGAIGPDFRSAVTLEEMPRSMLRDIT